jgi:flagella basal body P-ring formation protein FlgA
MVLVALWSLPAADAAAARPWRVALPDTVVIQGSKALLRDLSGLPVPAAAGQLVICAGGEPNTVLSVSRQLILRKLVSAGLGAGVGFEGAEICHVAFAGRELSGEVLTGEVRRQLADLVPPAESGAPASWFELEIPDLRFAAAGDWQVQLERRVPLAAGRNLVQVQVTAGEQREVFSTSVVLHSFGETARAVRNLAKDTALDPAQFSWEWQDLSDLAQGALAGRTALPGSSCTRSLTAGDLLRQADLTQTPLILAGDAVDLMVVRGQVAVTVRAVARQQGCLHQTIPVRNELTGRLVNARVAGPGLVEWRR